MMKVRTAFNKEDLDEDLGEDFDNEEEQEKRKVLNNSYENTLQNSWQENIDVVFLNLFALLDDRTKLIVVKDLLSNGISVNRKRSFILKAVNSLDTSQIIKQYPDLKFEIVELNNGHKKVKNPSD